MAKWDCPSSISQLVSLIAWWPSGKAPDSGSGYRRFESYPGSHLIFIEHEHSYLIIIFCYYNYMKTAFSTKLLGIGNNTGIQVPEENIAELGLSKRPPVNVSVNGFQYKSTVAVMKGKFMISFPKFYREATGIGAGDEIRVSLELDSDVREVEVPAVLKSALIKEDLTEVFSKLAYSKRKEFVRQINDAKSKETQDRRLEKMISLIKI